MNKGVGAAVVIFIFLPAITTSNFLDDIWTSIFSLQEPESQPTSTSSICERPGIFPDPIDCQKYFVCNVDNENSLISQEFYCPEGYAFNSEGAYCDLSVNVERCEGTVEHFIVKRESEELACNKGGMICLNCTKFYFCSDYGHGHYKPSAITSCPRDALTGEYLICDETLGACGSSNNLPACIVAEVKDAKF